MTREEAIERFEYVKLNATHQKDAGVSEYWQQEIDATIEAIDMAIEALQKADRKTEPQTMYYPQVDGITPSVIVVDEPQTDCSWK